MPLTPATIDAEHKTIHVDVQSNDLDELIDGPTRAFPPFSDNDLMVALFSKRTH